MVINAHDVIGLVQNLAVVIVFILIGNRLSPSSIHLNAPLRRLMIGLLFSAAGALSMTMPLLGSSGFSVSMKAVVAAMAGWLGGPLSAAVAGSVMILIRAAIGGTGVSVGIATVAIAAAIGSIYHFFRPADRLRPLQVVHPVAIGLLVALSGLGWSRMLPSAGSEGVPMDAPWEVLIVFPVASVLIHYFMNVEWSRKRKFAIDEATGLMRFEQLRLQLDKKISAGTPFYLALIDVNGYKAINAIHCEKTRSELLRQIGQRLARWIPENGRASRIEGEDFVVVLSDPATMKLPRIGPEFWDGMLAALSSPYWIHNRLYNVGFSTGYTTFEGGGATVDELLPYAYAALQQAKESGSKMTVQYHEKLSEQIRRRTYLEVHIRSAVSRNQLTIRYQPRYRLDTGLLIGFEASLTWRHPELGDVGEQEFLPIAEEMHAAAELGEWAIRQVCLALLQAAPAPSDLTMSLCVTGSQLTDGKFPELVRSVVEETGIAPERLELQLREQTLADKLDAMEPQLRKLHEYGIRLSLDGFGTASSASVYLNNLPFDLIKIDRALFQASLTREDRDFSEPMIRFIKQLRFDLLATGLDTYEQLAYLKKNRCDYAQGSLFGQPLSEDQLNAVVSGA